MIHSHLSLLWLLLHTPADTWTPIWPKATELKRIIDALRVQIWNELQASKTEQACIEKTAQRTSNQARETYMVLLPATVHHTESFVFLDPTRSITSVDATLERDDISTRLKIQVQTQTELQIRGYVIARTPPEGWVWIPFHLTVKPKPPVHDNRLEAAKRLIHRPFVEEFTSYGVAPQVPTLMYFSNSKFRAGVFDGIFRTLAQSGAHVARLGQQLFSEWKAHREVVKQWNLFQVPGCLDPSTNLWTISVPNRFCRSLRTGERVSVRCFENELWLYVGFIHKIGPDYLQVSFNGLSFTQTRLFPLLRFHLDARPYYFMGMALTKAALQTWLWEYPESRIQLLQGPPSSGKTRTLAREVAYVLQHPDTVVLVVTPTDSSADRFTIRLVEELGQYARGVILRLPEWNRNADEVDPNVLPYTVRDPHGYFTVDTSGNRRVWVMTPSMSRVFERLPPQTVTFTHILVDDAARISEPELLIPLMMSCAKKAPSMMLAGDLCQLGPRVYTRQPKHRMRSMFERLWKNHPKVRRRDLTVSYYTPPVLMDLATLKDHTRTSAFDNDFHRLRYQDIYSVEPDAPLVVYGVHGVVEDQTNKREVELIVTLVSSFQQLTSPRIMVISAYEQQNEYMRQACPGVQVGSVEDLMDAEVDIVLVSLVDEATDVSSEWIRRPQAFYTLLTRTRALLIVVGAPMFLQTDSLWRHLLAYAVRNRKYRGVELDEALATTLPHEPTHYEYAQTLLPEGILSDV